MTDHPHAKLLEEAEARFELLHRQDEELGGKDIALIREECGVQIAKQVVNLKGAAQWAIEYGRRLAAALETAAPTPPSTSLVEALHPLTLGKGTDFRTELDFRLEVATLVDPRVRRKMVRPETRRRILERADWIIKAIRERYLTARPAADAPPSENER